MESILARIADRAKTPQVTGLPKFVGSMKRTQESLQSVLAELSAMLLDEEALKKLAKRLEAGSIHVAHGALHWKIFKHCRSFVAVDRAFQGLAPDTRARSMSQLAALSGRQRQQQRRLVKEQGRVRVHVVEGGSEWLDVETLQSDRLAGHMTDAGWGWDKHQVGDDVDEHEWDDIPLARHARRLVAAAKTNRREYRTPRVRIVLPNLSRGNKDVRVLLDQLSRIDPMVRRVLEDQSSTLLSDPRPFCEAVGSLLGDEHEGLGPTLNLDQTIFVGLISDMANFRLEPQPWQAASTRMQIEEEARHGGLMARTLYPVLAGRSLVCTREAADHFHDVLRTVGTASEWERGCHLVPGDEQTRCMSPAAIRARFQQISAYPLPPSVQMPIRVVDEGWAWPSICCAVSEGRLPRVALDVARRSNFKAYELSTYMHGWATGTDGNFEQGGMRADADVGRAEPPGRRRLWAQDIERRPGEEPPGEGRNTSGQEERPYP